MFISLTVRVYLFLRQFLSSPLTKAEVHTAENIRQPSPGQLVKIPSQFKKAVNGPWGDNLRSVSTLTGAEVMRGAAHSLYVAGTQDKVQHAEYLLRNKVVSTVEPPVSGYLWDQV